MKKFIKRFIVYFVTGKCAMRSETLLAKTARAFIVWTSVWFILPIALRNVAVAIKQISITCQIITYFARN